MVGCLPLRSSHVEDGRRLPAQERAPLVQPTNGRLYGSRAVCAPIIGAADPWSAAFLCDQAMPRTAGDWPAQDRAPVVQPTNGRLYGARAVCVPIIGAADQRAALPTGDEARQSRPMVGCLPLRSSHVKHGRRLAGLP